MLFKRFTYSLLIAVAILSSSCSDLNDEVIPIAGVRIEVTLAQQQKKEYWASSPATYVTFLMPSIPYGFPYSVSSSTGYAGVLQVCGFDSQLYAFDLCCPVEHNPSIKISVDESNLNAVCRECGSTYDIFYGTGAPIEGIAAQEKYSLRKYSINYIASTASYLISN